MVRAGEETEGRQTRGGNPCGAVVQEKAAEIPSPCSCQGVPLAMAPLSQTPRASVQVSAQRDVGGALLRGT